MDPPSDLIDAFDPKTGKGLVAFVGSGPSCNAGVPSWSALLLQIAAEVNLEREVESYLSRGEFLQVAQFLADERSEAEIRERVARRIRQAAKSPSPIHELLVRIPFSGIITTNYDLLLTDADRTRRFNLPVTHESTGLREQLQAHFLLHLHGHVNEPGSIILTRRGYDHVQIANDRVRRFLSTVFQNFAVLFIGFGFGDPHVDDLLREFKDLEVMAESTVFAIVPSPFPPDRVRDRNLKYRHVNPIYIPDNNDHGVAGMIDWLEEFEKSLERISDSHLNCVRSLRPDLEAQLFTLLEADEFLSHLPSILSLLPNRPDLRNLARIGINASSIGDLFCKLGLSELRSILIELHKVKPDPVLEDALSCLPP
jgi:hypothetical protein